MTRFDKTLAAIVVTLGVLVGGALTTKAAVPATVERTAVYVPAPALDAGGPCGGDTIVTSLSYYPKADEHTFTAIFRADGGDGGGYAVFELGDAESVSVPLPAGGGLNYYTLTITAPYTIYRAPLLVYVGGTCAKDDRASGLTGGMVTLRDLNIFATP